MAVDTQKFLALPPSKKGGDLKPLPPANKSFSITTKIIQAKDILKGTLAAKKVEEKKEKKRAEQLKRKAKEKEIETPDKTDTKDAKKLGIKLPQMSWLDATKNFMFSVLFGWAAVRLLEFMPRLLQILKPLARIADFILKVGGFILSALVGFVDAGYKAFEWTRGAIKKTFGEDGAQKFDRFSGHLVKFMNLVMTVGMTAAALALAVGDQTGQGPGDMIDNFRRRQKIKVRVNNINQIKANRLAGVDLSPNQTKKFNQARKRLISQGKSIDEAGDIAARFARTQPKRGIVGRTIDTVMDSDIAKKVKNIDVKKLATQGKDLVVNQGKRAVKGMANFFSPIGDAAKWLKTGTISNFNKTMQAAADAGNALRKQWDNITKGAVDNFNKLAKGVQERVAQKILQPLMKFLEPVTKPLLALKDVIMMRLTKIPGLDNVLKKIGLNTLSDAPKIATKFGAKALPWIGGLFNLLFAYDRFANGDLIGGILESVSGGLDIAGIWPGSLAIDAYLFARDMFPETLMGAENALIDVIPGATGIKSQIEGVIKKLPDLGALVKMVSGGAKEEAKSGAKEEAKSDGVIGDSNGDNDKAVLPEGSGITPLKVSDVQKRNNGEGVASSASYEEGGEVSVSSEGTTMATGDDLAAVNEERAMFGEEALTTSGGGGDSTLADLQYKNSG